MSKSTAILVQYTVSFEKKTSSCIPSQLEMYKCSQLQTQPAGLALAKAITRSAVNVSKYTVQIGKEYMENNTHIYLPALGKMSNSAKFCKSQYLYKYYTMFV